MTPPIQDDLAELLAQSAWVRRIASRLVEDPDTADELVQQTYVAALERPPSAETPLRAWLATVVLNFARQRRRGDARRVVRETESARPKAQPSAHDVVAGLALQQELARAVSTLAEPYRSTLYQRFYEGLPPREIARRTNVPVKTVKTRLERGLAELRTRLDRDHGGREAWLSMLVPWIGREHATAVVLGGLIVQLKFALMIGAAVVCAVAVLFVTMESEESSHGTAVARTSSEENALSAPEPTSNVLASESTEPSREKASISGLSEPSARPFVASAPTRLHGRVIDTHGNAVRDLDIVVRDAAAPGSVSAPNTAQALARTNERGEFDAAPRDGDNVLEVDDREWTTVFRAVVSGYTTKAKPTIVVAPRNALGGLVLDPAHQPVEGAAMTIELDESLRRDVGEILDTSQLMSWSTTSDARGAFELSGAPRVTGKLVVRSPQFKELSLSLPDHPAPDMVIVLETREEPHVVVTGTVVDPNDKPVEGAWVVAGNRSTRSDLHGGFQFDLTATGQGQNAAKDEDGVWIVVDDRSEIRALKAGYLPAIHRLADGDELSRPRKAADALRKLGEASELRKQGKLDPIVLKLGASPLAIRGVVESGDGESVKNARLELTNDTPFGTLPGRHESTTWQVSMETMLRGGLTAPPVLTDGDGRFEFGGLLDKNYDLFVMDHESLRHATVKDVRAGSDGVVVQLGDKKSLKRVAGHVVTKNGDYLSGVTLYAGFKMQDGMPKFGARLASGPDGAFVFDGLALDDIGLQVAEEDLFLLYWRPIDPHEDLSDLHVVVSRRCFLQVDISDRADLADHAVPLNAKGEHLQIMEFMNGAIGLPDVIGLNDGKSEVVAVEEDTTTIVFYKGAQEVARKAVSVAPREKTIVRP